MRWTRLVVSDSIGATSESKASSASSAIDERESSVAIELQLLQERMAKLREQNRTLVEARERAEEERDDLEAQVSLLKSERSKAPRQETQIRQLESTILLKAREHDAMTLARDQALSECEKLKIQVESSSISGLVTLPAACCVEVEEQAFVGVEERPIPQPSRSTFRQDC